MSVKHRNAEVLVVDDEPQVLAAIEDMLEDECVVHTATSAEQAIKIVKEHKGISVIISDQRMPKVDGATFLADVQALTRATRIMLTGFADLEAVVKAVNEGKIFAYLSKPWDPDNLKVVVHQAIDYYTVSQQLDEERRLLDNLMNSLPHGIYFKDREHRYLLANQTAARLNGVDSPEDLIGKRTADIVKRGDVDYEQEEKQVFQTGLPLIDRTYKSISESGETQWYAVTKAPVLDKDNKPYRIVGITRDVTARVQSEMETRLLLEITRAAQKADSIDDIYVSILALIGEHTSWRYAEAWCLDLINDCLVQGPCWHVDTEQLKLFRDRSADITFSRGQGISGRVWDSGQPEWLEDTASVPQSVFRRQPWAREAGLGATLAVPVLLANKTVIGVLEFFAYEPRKEDKRQIELVAGIARQLGEIIARKQAETARKESEAQNRLLLESTAEGIFGLDDAGNATFCNPAALKLLGFKSARQVTGKNFHRLCHHSYADGSPYPEVDCPIAKALQTGLRAHVDNEVFWTVDGTAIPVEYRAEPISRDGKITGAVVSFNDITERKDYEARIAESEARFRDFGEAVSDFFAETDESLNIKFVAGNSVGKDGIDQGSIVGHSLLEYLDDGPGNDGASSGIADAIRRLEPFRNHEMAFTARNGDARIIRASGRPVTQDGAEFGGYRIAGQDVTAQVAMEQQVRENQRLLANVLESIPQLVYWKDKTFRYLGCNENFRAFAGLTASDSIEGKRDKEVLDEEIAVQFRISDERILQSGKDDIDFQWTYRDRDDRERFVRESKVLLRDPAGEVVGLLSVLADITEGRQMAQQLQQSQKMDAIGKLTGGVAHDFNNLLTVIIGNLQLMERSLRGNERQEKQVRMAYDAARRGADLTKRLLAFSRKQVLEPSVVNVNALVSGMEPLMQRTIGANYKLETCLDAGISTVKIDVSQFENAILNLVVNARDAMPEGGSISIESSEEVLDQQYADANRDVLPGRYVLVSVTDTGTGIPRELITQVFEPFFTTKEVGKGTGLGLSMVYGFVKQSGGHAAICSEVNVGTSIKLYFPISEETESKHDPAEDEYGVEMPGGSERILVVEDNREVRVTLCNLLDSLGYTVIEAENGDSGLEQFIADDSIDLILSDVVMPGKLTGPAMAEKALALRPGVKVLITSGYPQDAISRNGILNEGISFISKPYQHEDIARRVRLLLDGAP